MISFGRVARVGNKTRATRRPRIDRSAFLLLAPALAILLAFRVAPMLYGAWISLNRWDGIGDPKFVGLRNYQRLLADPNLLISLRNNVVLCAALLLGMVVPLFVAVLLHNRIWGWQFFRLVFFIPAAISPLVIGLYWSAFLRADGPLDAVLQALGLDSLSHHLWLADPTTALPWIAVILIWSTFGTAIILFMAGLAGINPDLYDAATVDGASWLQTFRHITVPGLMPIIIFWGIQLLIFSFTSLFAFIYTLTGGGPGHSTSVIEFELYNAAFLGRFMGYGSAIGMFILTIVFALVAAVMVLSGRRVEETSY